MFQKKSKINFIRQSVPLVWIACFSTFITSYSQHNVFQSGAREAAMANSSVTLSGTCALFHNPAGLVKYEVPSIGISYSNRYAMSELNVPSLTCVVPLQKSAAGISASYFGTTRYNEQKYSIGFAHRLGEKISAGIICDYLSINLPEEYESANVLAGELGLIVRPSENLNVACHYYNITHSSRNTLSDDNQPSFFSMGASWGSEIFLLASQVNLSGSRKPVISTGTEICLVSSLSIRMGVSSSEHIQYSFGLGYKQDVFLCDFALVSHPVLGFSSCISISYIFHGKSR